jgi:protein-tyrosine phosphatase
MHGHFLPGMDDGCKDAPSAAQLLQYSYSKGIRMMFATPHYYPVESVEEFLRRRQVSFDCLQAYLQENHITDIPEIRLGAEVAYRQGLGNLEELEMLCLGSSRYLLLELPFEKWSSSLLRDVSNICCARGITPVFAHMERYLDLQSRDVFSRILQMDGLVQMNGGALLKFPGNIRCRRLIRKGVVHLLGSDCHNMENRKPNLHLAADALTKHGLYSRFEQMAALSCRIFEESD